MYNFTLSFHSIVLKTSLSGQFTALVLTSKFMIANSKGTKNTLKTNPNTSTLAVVKNIRRNTKS